MEFGKHNFNTLIILDYNQGKVHYYRAAEELLTVDKVEDLIDFLGFNLDEVSYMTVDDDQMEVIDHKGIITKIEE